MKNLHAMIAEDEQLAREELSYLLDKEPDVTVCPSAQTGEQLINLYVKHEPDIIFLDVQMPGISGVEAAKKIADLAYIQKPLFIFTTAFDTYAVDAFEVEAVDYLLKPYDESRFQKTMKRVRKMIAQLDGTMEQDMPEKEPSPGGKLLIDDGERMVVISPESIYYAVPSKRVLEIHTKDDVIESRMTLNELENKLKGESFFRTHRSYLVNLDYIREITPWFNGTSNITLTDHNHTTIPVSRAARKVLLEIFKT
ncbi:LytR/AlgR family response regulator transcription factor [Virgibacillus ihumii]|uniref:LytR/AlgR family response regulator transcription factor n=1 Tax=Virgibacillus ihumii TaxID=2686091 RepID=UPI00157C7C98|nr:LytTR family DNA-binding domain-containing protein [Virgibacillus ihumii]